MTVRELLARIDSAELTEWAAYYTLEPFGEGIADRRHGILASLIANTNRNPDKHPQPYSEHDFIPWHAANRAQQGPVLLKSAAAQTSLVKRTLFGGIKFLKRKK